MIDNLYYGSKPCPCCSGKPQNISASIEFSPQVLEGFLHKIYEGFDTSREIEPTAWREVLRILNEGAVEGLSQSSFSDYEQNFLRNIRHSNEVFSAFKVHSWGSLMQERLLDEEGKLRPFKEWKKLVAPISNHHVGSWLKTEYDTAIIRAHQASQWQEFVANKDIFPNLRWMPTTSPSPEVLHKGFADRKLTKPVNDPFWEVHHPGNRWNCKCSLNTTDDPATEDIDDDIDTKKPSAQRGLENNPKDGQLFSDKHPYFPENCNACPFYRRSKGVKNWVKGLLVNREKDCHNCHYVDLELDKAKGYAPPMVETYKEEHGGQVLVSPYHGVTELDENIRIAKRVLHLFKGERVYLLPNLDPMKFKTSDRQRLLPRGVPPRKNADMLIKGMLFEAKSMLGVERGKSEDNQKNDIEKRYKDAKKQAKNVIIELPEHISINSIRRAMRNKMKSAEVGTIVILLYKDTSMVYTKTKKSGYRQRSYKAPL